MTMTAVNRPVELFGATDIYVPEHGYWSGMVMYSKRTTAAQDTSDILWSDWDAMFNDLRTDYVHRADNLDVSATDLMNAAIDLGTDNLLTCIMELRQGITADLESQYREMLESAEVAIDGDYWFTFYLITNRGTENTELTLSLLQDFEPDDVFSWVRQGHTIVETEMFLRSGIDGDLAAAIALGL